MEKDLSGAPNQKYINIVKEIVQTKFQPKLIDWSTRLTEQHKKGLHVIKQVVDLKGLKRFKRNPTEDSHSTNDLLNAASVPNAKDIFLKMTTTTQYNARFGERPKPGQDFAVLNQKPFIR